MPEAPADTIASRSSSGKGFRRIQLANQHLAVSFLPQLGAKMHSLQSMVTGREFLLQPQRPYRSATYGANFADYDTSGFDDCCPTVARCEYPHGRFAGRMMPDHGELWSSAWEHEIRGDEIAFQTNGKALPYILRKSVRLELSSVVVRYEIESTADREYAWLWSAHPLFSVEPGCRIQLPEEVSTVLVNWSHGDRLGRMGDSCGWPIARTNEGTQVDLSRVGSPEQGTADKLFTSRLSTGECSLQYPDPEETISLDFDPRTVPFLGLWICQGGWPSPEGHFTLALEPCTGRPDSLADAIRSGECGTLKPGEKVNWQLRVEITRPTETENENTAQP